MTFRADAYSCSSFVDVLMAMEAEVLMDDLLITRERKKASMDAPSTFDSRVASIAVPRGEVNGRGDCDCRSVN